MLKPTRRSLRLFALLMAFLMILPMAITAFAGETDAPAGDQPPEAPETPETPENACESVDVIFL